MLIPSWASFLIALLLILYLAGTKKVELWFGIFLGAIIFALLAQIELITSFEKTFLNLSNLFLCSAVALVPILGGIMKESGMMLELVQKLDIPKRAKLMFYPGLLGLLPIPGGALFSQPLVDEIDKNLSNIKKVAINVWYRHVFVLIYPLSASLIVASQIINRSLWSIVAVLTIPMFIMILIGYVSLVRGKLIKEKHEGNLAQFFHHLIPIIISPIISAIGLAFLPSHYSFERREMFQNLFFFIGMLIGVLIALNFAKNLNFARKIEEYPKRTYKQKLNEIPRIAKEIKFWKFPFLIYAMLYFKDVFTISDVPEFIGTLEMNMWLYITIGFFLGFSIGRIQLPISILLPIYMIQFGMVVMPYFDFILIYTSVFMGYVCTPVHPCISLSLEYFDLNFKEGAKKIFLPAIIGMIVIFSIYGLSLLS